MKKTIRPHERLETCKLEKLIAANLLSQALEIEKINTNEFELLRNDLLFILGRLNHIELQMVTRRLNAPKEFIFPVDR